MAKSGEKSKDMSREARIQREFNRIVDNLRDVPPHKRRFVRGLVSRAAFLRIELEDLEADINTNGSIETYHPNPEAVPITRVRAAAQQYDKLVRSYTTVCRQLADLIPAEPAAEPSGKKDEKPDPFTRLVAMRASGGMRRVK